MELEALSAAIDQLAAADPAALGDGATVVELHRLSNRLEAVVARATASFDQAGEWALDGARTASAWIATRCALPRAAARRRVALGRSLGQLEVAASAFAAGAIGADHLGALARVRNRRTAEALGRDEAVLVDAACTLGFEQFQRALAYWESMADPDGTEERAEERRARRSVTLVESFGGVWFGKMTLDPISGSIVSGELERLEQALFDAEWAAAKERLGHDPVAADLERTPDQRRADALVEMATRSRTAPADGQRPLPLFSVLVGYETLHGRICELASRTPVTPGSLLAWLDQALVERAVFAPNNRVEVGATTRLFTGALRRAIELRDRGCRHPYCDAPVDRCQVDHIVEYSKRGPTVQENGQLLCGYHNRLKNQRPPPPAG